MVHALKPECMIIRTAVELVHALVQLLITMSRYWGDLLLIFIILRTMSHVKVVVPANKEELN
jgi:hypothetical protein